MKFATFRRQRRQKQLLDDCMAGIKLKYLKANGKQVPDSDFLAYATEQLSSIAKAFSVDDFPSEDVGEIFGETRSVRKGVYLLSKQSDGGLALYAVRSDCASLTPPHRHNTWSIMVPVVGNERVHRFERADGGHLRLGKIEELEPDGSILIDEGGIHANKAIDPTPTLVFHLYGRCFEDLASERIAPEIFVTATDIVELDDIVEIVGKRKMFVEANAYFRLPIRYIHKHTIPIVLTIVFLSVSYLTLFISKFDAKTMGPHAFLLSVTIIFLAILVALSERRSKISVRDRYLFSKYGKKALRKNATNQLNKASLK